MSTSTMTQVLPSDGQHVNKLYSFSIAAQFNTNDLYYYKNSFLQTCFIGDVDWHLPGRWFTGTNSRSTLPHQRVHRFRTAGNIR